MESCQIKLWIWHTKAYLVFLNNMYQSRNLHATITFICHNTTTASLENNTSSINGYFLRKKAQGKQILHSM